MREWEIGTTNSVILPGLRDVDQDRINPSKKTYLKSGLTITGTLTTAAGVAVASFGAFAFITNTNGDWRGDVDIAADGSVSVDAVLEAKIVSAAPYLKTWKIKGRAIYGS